MNKNSIIIKKWLLILCITTAVMTSFYSCEKDDGLASGNPEILTIVSLGDEQTIKAGFPEELVRVDGRGLGDMREIVFDGKINVSFNTTLNSDKALFFNVPFDIEKGSRFGTQNVSFKNQLGVTVSSDFEIKQPAPILANRDTFSPDKAEAGIEIRVFGDWFYNVEDILIDGESVSEFTVISPQELSFIFPEGKTETTEFTVVTAAGSASKDLPIVGGVVEYLISDFDGNGVPSINDNYAEDWFSYGDNRFRIENGLGVGGTAGAEIVWDDIGTLTFTGSSHQDIAPLTTSTDAENAFILLDINGDDYPGTVMEFTIKDAVADSWIFKVPLEGSGWQTLRLRLSDFGFGFDVNNQSNGDPNPATFLRVAMQISQEGDAGVVPSGYRYDNLRLEVLELE